MAQHLVQAGLLHIQDLSLEGKDGLEAPVAPPLGRATGRITLHQEDP